MTIVYAADKTYVFAMAVSIESLLQTGNPDINYKIFILTDSTWDRDSMELLQKICERYKNCIIITRQISENIFKDVRVDCLYLSKSTLYRLLIAKMLPDEDICVYLDSDTLLCGDISDILKYIDSDQYVLYGVRDTEIQKQQSYIKGIGIPEADTYINAGVLVMNLRLIRNYELTNEFLKKLGNAYLYNDQDILNLCCFGKIGILNSDYNFFSIGRKRNDRIKLLHFAGVPDVKPWNNLRCRDSETWWNIAACFKDTSFYYVARKKAEEYTKNKDCTKLFAQCRNTRVIIWGYTDESQRLCDALRLKGTEVVGFIDGNPEKQGMSYKGILVMESRVLKKEKDVTVINAVLWHRKEVNDDLHKMGWKKSKILQFYPKTKEYYRVLDERYEREEFYELLDYQYDIQC